MPRKNSDLSAYVIAVVLAAACIGFAGYKVVILRTMDSVPADLGLNFPPPKKKIITDDGIEVDPLTTQSTGRALDAASDAPLQQPYVKDGPVLSYRLITVINGVAFVEIETIKGKEIVPATAGATLRGAGTVEWIERHDGRWVLRTPERTLVAGDPASQ